MGLHVHDIARFDFAQVGRAPSYFFVFFPNNYLADSPHDHGKWFGLFSSLIADDGIAVSDESTDISWIFGKDLPAYISPHAFMRSIILIGFIKRELAESFKNFLTGLLNKVPVAQAGWERMALSPKEMQTSLVSLPGSVVLSVPAEEPARPDDAKCALLAIVDAIRSGECSEALHSNDLASLAKRLRDVSRLPVLQYRRAIIFDMPDWTVDRIGEFIFDALQGRHSSAEIKSLIDERFSELDSRLSSVCDAVEGSSVTAEEKMEDIAERLAAHISWSTKELHKYQHLLEGSLVHEIASMREWLRELPQTPGTNALLREIKNLHKSVDACVNPHRKQQATLKTEYAVGLQLAGSGVKGSLELSTDVTERVGNIQGLIAKCVSIDRIVAKFKGRELVAEEVLTDAEAEPNNRIESDT